MMILAQIAGSHLLYVLLSLLIIGVIFWLLFWLVNYVALPEPFNKVAHIILAITAVIILVNALLSLIGKPFIVW
jgi:hypothetical protein